MILKQGHAYLDNKAAICICVGIGGDHGVGATEAYVDHPSMSGMVRITHWLDGLVKHIPGHPTGRNPFDLVREWHAHSSNPYVTVDPEEYDVKWKEPSVEPAPESFSSIDKRVKNIVLDGFLRRDDIMTLVKKAWPKCVRTEVGENSGSWVFLSEQARIDASTAGKGDTSDMSWISINRLPLGDDWVWMVGFQFCENIHIPALLAALAT